MGFKPNVIKVDPTALYQPDEDGEDCPDTICRLLAEVVMPEIDELPFQVLYSGQPSSAPNYPVNILIGAHVYKRYMQISDKVLVYLMRTDKSVRYALHIKDGAKAPSVNTLSRFRTRVDQYMEETGISLMDAVMWQVSTKLNEMMQE
ncbi:MAG: transposase [Clostridiales bacterium]|jgi:hypothetical protein|nr:transposase [Clostridiales bacterium]